jgi:hypothetical protein
MPKKNEDDAYDMFCVDFMSMEPRTRSTHLHSMSYSAREKGRIWRLVLETRDYIGGDKWTVTNYNVSEDAVKMVDEIEIRTEGKRFRAKSKSGVTGFVGANGEIMAQAPASVLGARRGKVIDL